MRGIHISGGRGAGDGDSEAPAAAAGEARYGRWQMIGLDGLVSLVLANLVILLTAGTSLAWQIGKVYRTARTTACTTPPVELLLVLGVRLRRERVTGEYAQRLQRAATLLRTGHGRRIMILGGKTGGATVSEAAEGRRFLVARGVPEPAICIEERSTHTLENLRCARVMLGDDAGRPLALVSSRYHLARSEALARGLRLRPLLCAAEDAWQVGWLTPVQLIQEGYFLHWYSVGSIWTRLTRNRRSLAKIT